MAMIIIPLSLLFIGGFVLINSDIWENMRKPKRASSIEPKHSKEFEHLINFKHLIK